MFSIVAVIMVLWAVKPIGQTLKAKDWVKAPARITTNYVDARNNQYMVRAKYEYIWQGEIYNAERVFFDEVVGLRKRYYHQINRQLSAHKTDSNPIEIWVNPAQPSQTVIFKTIKWDKLLFRFFCASVFAFFGFGPLILWAKEMREKRRIRPI